MWRDTRSCVLRARIASEALIETSSGVGPGIITGGVTTALAFAAAALTQFTGVVELGLIAGGGILLCVVAAMTVLPAMIRLVDRSGSNWRAPRPLPFAALCTPVLWFPSHRSARVDHRHRTVGLRHVTPGI